MSKFQIGDIVKCDSTEIKTGEIKCIIERLSNNNIQYSYLVFDKDSNKYFNESENRLKLIKRLGAEDDSDRTKSLRKIAESVGYGSDLKIGDVVKFRDGMIGQYVVSSIIETAYGEELYNYELISASSYRKDESYICGRLMLEFQYHDAAWEKYIVESVENGLPAWRGKLYNFMQLEKYSWGIYEDNTLPPKRMEHILQEHSLYRRIWELMSIPKMRDEIIKRMNRTEKEVEQIMVSIEMKIAYFNGKLTKDELPKDRKGHATTFNFDENRLIEAVSYCDKYLHTNDMGEITESKDHFPPYMSDYDIMKAIKEAYRTAEKIEIPKKKYSTQSEQVLFQGISKDRLVIQFYYDFEHNEISTAYPVFVDTTNRPDLRHPGDKNKKRQN